MDEESYGGQQAPTKQPDYMEKFFKEVERAKAAIHRVKGATTTIKQLQDEAVNAIGSEPEQAVSSKLATILTQANKDCALAKRVLEGLKKETETMDRRQQQADIRVRENLHANILQTLVAAVRAYQTAQQVYSCFYSSSFLKFNLAKTLFCKNLTALFLRLFVTPGIVGVQISSQGKGNQAGQGGEA